MTLGLICFDFLSRLLLQLLPTLPYILIDIIIIIVPTVGYIDQVRLMCSRKDPHVYTTNTALVLISANLIKIVFYFDEPFDTKILGQAICLPIVAFVHTFFHFKYLDVKDSENKPYFAKNNPLKFLNVFTNIFKHPKQAMKIYSCLTFEQFMTSIMFYFIIFLSSYFIMRFTIGVHTTVNFFSVMANIIDSCVSLPAFNLIVFQGNIETTSVVLIMQYIFGDMFKIMLFKASHSPWPFMFGGFLQLTLDTIISIKFIYLTLQHRKEEKKEQNVKPSESLSDIPIRD